MNVIRNSGQTVPEWMLKLRKVRKHGNSEQRKLQEFRPPRRKHISSQVLTKEQKKKLKKDRAISKVKKAANKKQVSDL